MINFSLVYGSCHLYSKSDTETSFIILVGHFYRAITYIMMPV